MKIDENRCFIEYVVKPEPLLSFWCLFLASEILSKSHGILVLPTSPSLWFWSSQSPPDCLSSPILSCPLLFPSLRYVSCPVCFRLSKLQFIMLQIHDASNSLCFEFMMFQIRYVSNSLCFKCSMLENHKPIMSQIY